MTALGAEGRRFESCLPDHENAFISMRSDDIPGAGKKAETGTERKQADLERAESPGLSPERLALTPVTGRAALRWIAETHRHLPKLQGALFAVGVAADGELVGVATAGNPPRVWQGTGRIVISRVSTDQTPNACSMLYGAICRAAKALGYREAWTYTLPDEPGTSLRAAGFQDMGLTKAEEWDRPSRARRPAERPEAKRRWMRQLAPPLPRLKGAA